MSKAQEIISEIYHFLDKFSLKKNKLEKKDLIAFIEEKWALADNAKYEIHAGSIIIARMINEYSAVKDFKNTKRWLEMMDAHALSKKHPAYINNYYNGECCLKCGQEQEALKYLRLCYEENPEYIFTRGQACIDFFNKHSGTPVLLPKDDGNESVTDSIELKEWQSFFGGSKADLRYTVDGDDLELKQSEKHKSVLEFVICNQSKILNAILSELLKRYPAMQEHYGYEGDDKQDFMPDVHTIHDFADLLSPVAVHILSVYKNNFPYIGYQFSCSWDLEHGFGVMMFQDRVVEIGGADSSFLDWIAKKDLEQQ
jgi:hypothetical protein